MGLFSLDPQGNLRWQDQGDPELTSTVTPSESASEVVFGSGQLYFGWTHTSSAPPAYAFDLDGDQAWFTGDLDVLFLSFPRLDPQGRVIGVWGQTGIIALEPDGDTDWITVHPSQINVRRPTVDTQGVVYSGADRSEMWALNPNGSIRWVLPSMPLTSLSKLGISPDDAVIIADFQRENEPTSITAHEPSDGSFLWQVELQDIGGRGQNITSLEPTFSADARTVYVTTSSGSPDVNYSRIYAIQIAPDPAPCATDQNGDGFVNEKDLLAFLSALAGPQQAASAQGDGGAQDVLEFMSALAHAWGACP